MAVPNFPLTKEGMKDDLRQYMRSYISVVSDDLLESFQASWPERFHELPEILKELVEEGFLTLTGTGGKHFIADITPENRMQ